MREKKRGERRAKEEKKPPEERAEKEPLHSKSCRFCFLISSHINLINNIGYIYYTDCTPAFKKS